ncbi:MAG: S9 family peptidase [Bacteroidetes bacterium]|nr:S9 family peptidase [Bacteroidota bacterium]MBM3425076.1 S9 family peptidase [Bacteroidota bacterium]
MKKSMLLVVLFAFNNPLLRAQEPVAPRIDYIMEKHGHQRNDPYYWMRERDTKPVLDYLKAENEYAKAYFKSLDTLVGELLNEFEQRIDPNETSAPFIFNGCQYQVRNVEGLDYQQIFRYTADGKAVLFFDENERAKGKSFYELASWVPSVDNEILAISEDFTGRRKYEVRFRMKGKFLKDVLTETSGGLVWANDNKTVYYSKKDPETLREYLIFRHQLGTPQSSDELIYEEKDDKFSVGIGKAITGKYVLIYSYSSTTSEIQLMDADNPKASPQVFLKREAGHIYEIEHHDRGFYILSNDNAVNNRVLFSKTIPSDLKNCVEIVPHNSTVLLEGLSVFKDYLLLEERSNGLLKLKLKGVEDGKESYISVDGETYYLGLAMNDDYHAKRLYFVYNSMTTPSRVMAYDLPSSQQSIFFENKIRDVNFEPSNYVSKRVWATANDGTQIPISLVYRKGTMLSKAPLLLYGYGSYGFTIPDVFSPTRLSLLDRGFVFATAHIRGCKYLGEEWYQNGKFDKKTNTFTDFINAAEFLGHMNYCDPARIYANGGSAGGLLMGAVSNMAPYLFKGIVSEVPFVDVVTTMLDETIPLTTSEYEEWGNPNDPYYYSYLLKYSPYDNLHAMDYPAMFITSGYHDSQVQYWEPAKYVAKLRTLRTNNNALIFECNMDAGHGGGSGRTTERFERAKIYAFILGLEQNVSH